MASHPIASSRLPSIEWGTMTIQIAPPSILPADFCNLERDLKAISTRTDHVDVMDHHLS